jgi:hypothetical protein
MYQRTSACSDHRVRRGLSQLQRCVWIYTMQCYLRTDLSFDGCLKTSYHIQILYNNHYSFKEIKHDFPRKTSSFQNYVQTLKYKQYLVAHGSERRNQNIRPPKHYRSYKNCQKWWFIKLKGSVSNLYKDVQ